MHFYFDAIFFAIGLSYESHTACANVINKMNNKFDINIIVNLNGGEVMDTDIMGNTIYSINPKMSHAAASDPNYQMYYNYPWHWDIIGDNRNITKQVWKKLYGAYRRYNNQ